MGCGSSSPSVGVPSSLSPEGEFDYLSKELARRQG